MSLTHDSSSRRNCFPHPRNLCLGQHPEHQRTQSHCKPLKCSSTFWLNPRVQSMCAMVKTLYICRLYCINVYIYTYVGSGHPSYDDNPGNGYEWNDQPPISEIYPSFEHGTCKTPPHCSFFACTRIVLVNPTSIVLITCSNASLKLLPNPKYGFL